jgi:hypothetical protein
MMNFTFIDNNTISTNGEYSKVFVRAKEAITSLGGKIISENVEIGRIEGKWNYGLNIYGIRVEIKISTLQDETVKVESRVFFKDAHDIGGACEKKLKKLIEEIVDGDWEGGEPPEYNPNSTSIEQTTAATDSSKNLFNIKHIAIFASALTLAIFIYFSNSAGVDIYSALVNRVGMQKDNPKLESKEILAQCVVDGKRATLGVVTFSYNLMNMGGINRRNTFGPMIVAALERNDGQVVTVIGDYSNEEQSNAVKNKWVDFWGCKLN